MPTITANGFDIHFELTGPPTAPAVVFVNALGGTTAMWREQVTAFSPRYRCLVYDANGHGGSSARPMPPAIDAFADDLLALLDALGIERPHIVGASIGGMTAQVFAARNPERVGRLVLLGSTPKMPDASLWTKRAAEVRRDGLGNVAAVAMTRWFTEGFRTTHPGRVEETRAAFVAGDAESYARACEAIAAMDLTPRLGSIASPTLVIAAAEDHGTPLAAAETIRAGIAGAAMIVVPRAAHLMMIERAADVAAWIGAFLNLQSDMDGA